jgi:hypothetical protein
MSITNLNISYNTLKPTYAMQYFNQSRNVTSLTMEHTKLSKWSGEDIFNLFSPLYDSLVDLKMMETYFQSIPSKALRCFKKLEVLNLLIIFSHPVSEPVRLACTREWISMKI